MTKTVRYSAIHSLHDLLTQCGIPHEFGADGDGWKVSYPDSNRKTVRCVARQHRFSKGADDNLIEMVGLLTEEERMADTGTRAAVGGGFTPEEICRRIKENYKGRNDDKERI